MTIPAKIISKRFSINNIKKYSPPVQAQQIPFIEEVKQKLNSEAYKLIENQCPCGTEAQEVIIAEFDRYGLPLNSVLCMTCGTVRFNPYLEDNSVAEFYTNYYQKMYNRSSDAEAYFERQKQYGFKFFSICKDYLKPGSWVFEVGCGAGGALKVFKENNFNVAGCDYDHPLLEFGSNKDVPNLFYGSLQDIENNLPKIKADLIFMNHVFEHVTNPAELLTLCKKLLTENGTIVISVPELIHVDRYDYFADDLMPMLHIAHKFNYTIEGLTYLGARLNLSVRYLTPDPAIKTSTSHMPELWVAMNFLNSTTINKPELKVGKNTLRKLKRIESSYNRRILKHILKRIAKKLLKKVR